METAVPPPDAIAGSMYENPVVEAFFDTLRKEQTRFLDAIGAARSLLPNTGELANVSAVHGQLTRRFLDAQRSILRHRADVEAELDHIASASPSQLRNGIREPRVANGEVAVFQLATFLDDWWRAENQESQAAINVARGRPLVPRQSPTQILDALDAADPDDLGSLLTTLADQLETSAPRDAQHKGRDVNDNVIKIDPVPAGLLPIERSSWSR